MRSSWPLITMAAGGLLLGIAHGALADHQRSRNDRFDQSYWSDRGDRYDRSDRHAARDEARERRWRLERRDDRRDRWGDEGVRRSDRDGDDGDRARVNDRRGSRRSGSPFTYIRAADARRGSTNGDHSRGRDAHR